MFGLGLTKIWHYRTNPTSSLNAEADIPALKIRRLKLMTNLFCSISQLTDISAHSILFETTWPQLRVTYRKAFTHIRSALNHQLNKKFKFHCLLIIIPAIRPWAMPKSNINLDLTKSPKKSTRALSFRALLHGITIKY